MTYSTQERGGALLYAVIAVAFLSGLSLYLQKMSDPKIFQINDTQKILNTEYLSDSMETLLSITASNNSTLLKNKSDIIDNSTNNVTDNFITNVKNIFKNQEKIFLFSKEDVLIASASKTSDDIYNTDITTVLTDNPYASAIAYVKLNYNTRSASVYINKNLTISISINPL